MNLRYFNTSDFDSPDSEGSGANMQRRFLEMLDEARHKTGIPFRVNSGFRTLTHHLAIYKRLGRKPPMGSYHLKGRAADIAYSTPAERDAIVKNAASLGFKGFGIGRSFVHLDNRDDFAIWGYGTVANSVLDSYRLSVPIWATEREGPDAHPLVYVAEYTLIALIIALVVLIVVKRKKLNRLFTQKLTIA